MIFDVTLVVKVHNGDPDPGDSARLWAVGMGGMLDPEYVEHEVGSLVGRQQTLQMKLDFEDYSALATKLNRWFCDPFFDEKKEGGGFPVGALLWWGTKEYTNGIGGPRIAVIPGEMA